MRKNQAGRSEMPTKTPTVRKVHHASMRRVKDCDGHYDIDGVSQTQNYQVIIASEDSYIPPKDFTELFARVRFSYEVTHHP